MLFWHLGLTAAIIFVTLGRKRIDYRIVLLGAILPDLLDKPIGRIFFEDQFQSSRLFGHTLAFVLALFVLSQLILRGETLRRWFILSIACLLHLGLDAMWNDPITLFWPLFGTAFPPHPLESYWLDVLVRPFEHPAEGLKELAGLACLVYLAVGHGITRGPGLRSFIRTGRLPAKVPKADSAADQPPPSAP